MERCAHHAGHWQTLQPECSVTQQPGRVLDDGAFHAEELILRKRDAVRTTRLMFTVLALAAIAFGAAESETERSPARCKEPKWTRPNGTWRLPTRDRRRRPARPCSSVFFVTARTLRHSLNSTSSPGNPHSPDLRSSASKTSLRKPRNWLPRQHL